MDHHDHHHNEINTTDLHRAFYIGIALNLLFTVIEFTLGYLNHSLALIADATHNLSDVASLIISLVALKLMDKIATTTYTYGYKKASILASFINSVLLIIVVFSIFAEAIERIFSQPQIGGVIIIITAAIGVIINTISAYLFYKGQKSDLNVKSAFIHLMVDALVSVGVLVSGIILHYTHWHFIDTIISIIIAIVIFMGSWNIFKESFRLILNGTPKGIDPNEIKSLLLMVSGVKEIHHLHIWALSTRTNALSVHVVLEDHYTLQDWNQLKEVLKHQLLHHGIQHITLEPELSSLKCTKEHCN